MKIQNPLAFHRAIDFITVVSYTMVLTANIYQTLYLIYFLQIFVIFMLAIFLGVCAYGAFQVKDGLDVAEMIPRHKVEYAFVSARFQYFSFYQMHAVTKESFDYANKQRLLHSYHQSFAKVRVVLEVLKNCVLTFKANQSI